MTILNEGNAQNLPTHVLSPVFVAALEKGALKPILDAVKEDETLMLGIRGGYISIYYRGGELLTIENAAADGSFTSGFNKDYSKDDTLPGRLRLHGLTGKFVWRISDSTQAAQVVGIFHELKRVMDHHAKIKSGHEREFQQLIARVNNRSRSANSSHYFITDIEHSKDKARFDMLGVRWRHDERQRGDCLIPVLFEVKHGEKVINGEASLSKHLRDALTLVANPTHRAILLANIESQFNALKKLGLLNFNKNLESFTLVKDQIQIVFVIAEYPPHSNQLRNALKQLRKVLLKLVPTIEAQGVKVELRFAGASLCGYAMYEETMLSLEDLRKLLGMREKDPDLG